MAPRLAYLAEAGFQREFAVSQSPMINTTIAAAAEKVFMAEMRPTYTDEPSASPLMREEDAELDAIRLYYLNGLREYQHFKKLGLAHLHNAITRAETRRLFPGSGPLGDPTPEEASARLQYTKDFYAKYPMVLPPKESPAESRAYEAYRYKARKYRLKRAAQAAAAVAQEWMKVGHAGDVDRK